MTLHLKEHRPIRKVNGTKDLTRLRLPPRAAYHAFPSLTGWGPHPVPPVPNASAHHNVTSLRPHQLWMGRRAGSCPSSDHPHNLREIARIKRVQAPMHIRNLTRGHGLVQRTSEFSIRREAFPGFREGSGETEKGSGDAGPVANARFRGRKTRLLCEHCDRMDKLGWRSCGLQGSGFLSRSCSEEIDGSIERKAQALFSFVAKLETRI